MAAPTAPAASAAVPVAPSGPRVIVGLGAQTLAAKARSRKQRNKTLPAPAAEEVPVAEEAVQPVAEKVEELEPVEQKKTSAVEACAKRIRAANKKIVSFLVDFVQNWSISCFVESSRFYNSPGSTGGVSEAGQIADSIA